VLLKKLLCVHSACSVALLVAFDTAQHKRMLKYSRLRTCMHRACTESCDTAALLCGPCAKQLLHKVRFQPQFRQCDQDLEFEHV